MIGFYSHHKCATRWLVVYLSKVASLNGRSLFHTDYADDLRDPTADLGLFCNATYRFVADHGLSGVHVIRNPMNIVVSSYYSHLATHGVKPWPQLVAQRRLLTAVSKEEGMFLTLAFIERADIADRAIGPLLSLRQWNYEDPRFTTVTMESAVTQPQAVMRPLLSGLVEGGEVQLPTDAEMAFANFADGRAVGQVDNSSHYRSGAEDAWRGELPPAIIAYIRERFSDLLQRFYPDCLID